MRSGLFLVLLACAMAACSATTDPSAPEPSAVQSVRLEFVVRGMTCGGCEKAITAALQQQPGVSEAGADHVAGSAWATVAPGTSTGQALAATIRELGYTAEPAP